MIVKTGWANRISYFQLAFFISISLAGSNSLAQQASINGNVLTLPVVTFQGQAFHVELTIVEDTDPVQLELTNGQALIDADISGASTFDGLTLNVPQILVDGTNYWVNFTLTNEELLIFELGSIGLVEASEVPEAPSCERPLPDLSNGTNNPTIVRGLSVERAKIADGGPGTDGIPAVERPVFSQNFSAQGLASNQLVVGVKIGDEIRAYPHTILDWHEIINDQFVIEGKTKRVTLSYCPLTGSAVLWEGFAGSADKTFGTSGFLYNSNLVLYDRETRSLWSQMLEQSIGGPSILAIPDKLQVIETTWGTWLEMYPQTTVMTTQTGFTRSYGVYPYGSFRSDNSLVFSVDNLADDRLHRKERVVGLAVGSSRKVYPISSFSSGVSVVNDRVGEMDVIAVGSSGQNFGAVFNRELEDCTVLDFSSVENQLPIVMIDNEGTEWDIFGSAVNGPRAGTQLQKTNSFIAYWFAWTAFFPFSDIQP